MWRAKLGLRQIKGRVIHHGLPDPELAVPNDYPRKPEGCVDFVYVAQFYPWKGQVEFMDAWGEAVGRVRKQKAEAKKAESRKQPAGGWSASGGKAEIGEADRRPQTADQGSGIRDEGRRLRLIFVGDGMRRKEAEEKAERLGVQDSVVFMGSRPDGGRYFNGADVAVHMPTEPEAFGLVVLEAMSRGKVVLASKRGGITEVVGESAESGEGSVEDRRRDRSSPLVATMRQAVESGKCAVLVEPDETKAVADGILRVALEPAGRTRFGKNGKRRWIREFSVERMVKNYREFLESCA
jgi:glycosyltransferase involved in cell wall biosynthesis